MAFSQDVVIIETLYSLGNYKLGTCIQRYATILWSWDFLQKIRKKYLLLCATRWANPNAPCANMTNGLSQTLLLQLTRKNLLLKSVLVEVFPW